MKENTMNINVNAKTNLDEFSELVEEVQRNAEALKLSLEKLNTFKIEIKISQSSNLN